MEEQINLQTPVKLTNYHVISPFNPYTNKSVKTFLWRKQLGPVTAQHPKTCYHSARFCFSVPAQRPKANQCSLRVCLVLGGYLSRNSSILSTKSTNCNFYLLVKQMIYKMLISKLQRCWQVLYVFDICKNCQSNSFPRPQIFMLIQA